MITEVQVQRIRKFVDKDCFDVDKLISYLRVHDIVGIEVFELVAKDVNTDYSTGKKENVLSGRAITGETQVFESISVNTFVNRIPFYFAVKECHVFNRGEEEGTVRIQWLEFVLCSVGEKPGTLFCQSESEPLTLDTINRVLEYVVTESGISVAEIDKYLEPYYCGEDEICYAEWLQYVEDCMKLGWSDLMPHNLFYSFNLARVELRKEPIIFPVEEFPFDIYDPDEIVHFSAPYVFYRRTGKIIEVYGRFPVDQDGLPVMKWIGVDAKDPEKIEYSNNGEIGSVIVITIKPTTRVRLMIPSIQYINDYPIKDGEVKWVTIYSGAQMMKFNNQAIKRRRKELGFTQSQVAEAVQANLRTYQKWESGETTPDGFFLLRILNWLDIANINDVITYTDEQMIDRDGGQ